MFRVNRKALDAATLELQQQLRRLNQAIQETEQVAMSLSFHSGMEETIFHLKKIVGDMEIQRNQLLQMMTVLREITEFYGGCERNIMDYADGAQRVRQQSFYWFDNIIAKSISDKLKQLIVSS